MNLFFLFIQLYKILILFFEQLLEMSLVENGGVSLVWCAEHKGRSQECHMGVRASGGRRLEGSRVVHRASPGPGPGRSGSRGAGRWFRPGSRVAGRRSATPRDPANPDPITPVPPRLARAAEMGCADAGRLRQSPRRCAEDTGGADGPISAGGAYARARHGPRGLVWAAGSRCADNRLRLCGRAVGRLRHPSRVSRALRVWVESEEGEGAGRRAAGAVRGGDAAV